MPSDTQSVYWPKSHVMPRNTLIDKQYESMHLKFIQIGSGITKDYTENGEVKWDNLNTRLNSFVYVKDKKFISPKTIPFPLIPKDKSNG